MKIMIRERQTTLLDCPLGLFYITYDSGEEQLCMKTGYGNNGGGVEAYIVESGEKLSFNGLTYTHTGCLKIKVIPIKIV